MLAIEKQGATCNLPYVRDKLLIPPCKVVGIICLGSPLSTPHLGQLMSEFNLLFFFSTVFIRH